MRVFAIGVSATQYSCQMPSGITALQCSEAALMMPLFHACGTVSLPCEWASSAIRSVSVMPPQRVTSGCTRSTWARSISSRKPHHVASCSPAVIADVDRVGELGVRLVLVRLERLLEPVDADLLVLARDLDRALRVGDVAEARVDHDLDAVARRPPWRPPRGRRPASSPCPSGPQPSLTAVKFCSFSAVIASVTSSVVSGISIEA